MLLQRLDQARHDIGRHGHARITTKMGAEQAGDTPLRIYQRPTGEPRIHGDAAAHVATQQTTAARPGWPADGADDAPTGLHALGIGTRDSEDQAARSQTAGSRQFGRRSASVGQAQEGKIVVGRPSHQRGGRGLTIRQSDSDVVIPFHHVVGGDNQPIRPDHTAGGLALARLHAHDALSGIGNCRRQLLRKGGQSVATLC